MKIKYNYGVDMSFDIENTLNNKLTKVGVNINLENKRNQIYQKVLI